MIIFTELISHVVLTLNVVSVRTEATCVILFLSALSLSESVDSRLNKSSQLRLRPELDVLKT